MLFFFDIFFHHLNKEYKLIYALYPQYTTSYKKSLKALYPQYTTSYKKV